jgi:hypothetical protein
VELGAGDGRFLLRVARKLFPGWQGTSAVLLDRLNIVSPETRQGFETLGWQMETLEADALDWAAQAAAPACEAMLANLFLHDFCDAWHRTAPTGNSRQRMGSGPLSTIPRLR